MSFLSDAEIVITALDNYYRESISKQKPVIDQAPLETLISDLELSADILDSRLSGERLAQFLDKYLESTTRLLHESVPVALESGARVFRFERGVEFASFLYQ